MGWDEAEELDRGVGLPLRTLENVMSMREEPEEKSEEIMLE